jgi:hypothetical protein
VQRDIFGYTSNVGFGFQRIFIWTKQILQSWTRLEIEISCETEQLNGIQSSIATKNEISDWRIIENWEKSLQIATNFHQQYLVAVRVVSVDKHLMGCVCCYSKEVYRLLCCSLNWVVSQSRHWQILRYQCQNENLICSVLYGSLDLSISWEGGDSGLALLSDTHNTETVTGIVCLQSSYYKEVFGGEIVFIVVFHSHVKPEVSFQLLSFSLFMFLCNIWCPVK